RKYGVKLRGGVVGINKIDLLNVNGYDEKFIGWGNEDDNLYKRLHFSGVRGINPFLDEFPLHLYHEPFHSDGQRVNKYYHKGQKFIINNKNYRCKYGLDNPYEPDKIKIFELN
ncbi:MAG: glycosyl transferase, partial [Candidatus Delongbacteria bacterium]|nr:glycosyl transferase [Candidatus Delongbacteria bacterium]